MMRSRGSFLAVGASAVAAMLFGAVAIQFAQNPTISGRIVDSKTGDSVVRASIMFRVPSRRDRSGRTIKAFEMQTTSDESGDFEMIPQDQTQGIVTVSAPGYATAKRAWPSKRSQGPIELERPVTVAGRLYNGDSDSPADGKVVVIVQHPKNMVLANLETRNGMFQATGLPSGRTLIVVKNREMAPVVIERDFEPGAVARDIVVRLRPAGMLTGHIFNDKGQPVAGAEIRVRYPRAPASQRGLLEGYIGGKTRTGPDGAYAVQGIVPEMAMTVQARVQTKASPLSETVLQVNERREMNIVIP